MRRVKGKILLNALSKENLKKLIENRLRLNRTTNAIHNEPLIVNGNLKVHHFGGVKMHQ